MRKKIMSLFLSFVMICGMFLGWTNVAKAANTDWSAFEVTFSTDDEFTAGKDVTCSISITNTTDQTITTDWINHWYYKEFNTDIPGEVFGTLTDENGTVITGEGVVFNAGETKTYTLTGTVPDTWNELSQLVIVVGNEQDEYYGQVVYPEIVIPEEPTVNVDSDGTGADNVFIYASPDVLRSVFTEEELNSGNKLDIMWKVNKGTLDSISAEKKALIQNKAQGKDVAMLLDVELWKCVNSEENTQITELAEPVYFIIDIPEKYLADNRVFTVIREHNGIAEEFEDLDNEPNTVTIRTDKFSYYALAYKDVKADEKPNPGEETGNTVGGNTTTDQKTTGTDSQTVTSAIPKTGDAADMVTPLVVCAVMAGVIAVLRRKKMA